MENIIKFLLFAAALFLIYVVIKAVSMPVAGTTGKVMVGRADQTWLNGVPVFAY